MDKTVLRQIAVILLGTLILAFAYYHINVQNQLSEGGFVGLALLGKYAFGWSPAWTALLLDIPVLLLAWRLKGRKFMLFTLIGALSFSLFYALFEQLSLFVVDLHGNLLAAAVLSGLLTGVGAGIVLRYGGATGGDDVLSKLISDWSGWKIGNVFFASDAIVLVICLFYLPLKETMYTVLAVWIAGKVITWTMTTSLQVRHLFPAKRASSLAVPVSKAIVKPVATTSQSLQINNTSIKV